MILNIILLFLSVEKLGHQGIALSLSITSWFNALTLYFLLYYNRYWYLTRSTLFKVFKLIVISILTLVLLYFFYSIIMYTDMVIVSNIYIKVLLLSFLIFISVFSFIFFGYIIGLFNFKNLLKKNIWGLYEGKRK